ncbi:MAG: hypothetical protein Ct9H90mP25_0790 [Gammaproteobacteria bacterium]|nr:MAG: hypothetical protein Ct9H90mP25_0790 [Gammaproteobacteria bacterium]
MIDLGVSWIDVAGTGGTSWSQIEHTRSGLRGTSAFAEWGVKTREAIEAIRENGEIVQVGWFRRASQWIRCRESYSDRS